MSTVFVKIELLEHGQDEIGSYYPTAISYSHGLEIEDVQHILRFTLASLDESVGIEDVLNERFL